MARNTTLQILRTPTKTNLQPTTPLADGELLYDKETNKLFIGTETTLSSAKEISAIPTTGDNITVSKVTAKSTLTACNGFSATNGTIKIGTNTSNTIMLENASFTNATITNANIKKVEVGFPTSTTEYLLLDPYGSETGQLKINEASIIGALDASDIYSTSVTAANSDFTNATITNASITNATIGSLNIPAKSNVNSVIATIGNIKITSCNASFESITINGSTVEPVVGYTASQSFQNTLNAIKIGSTGYNLPQGGGSGDTVTIITATSAGKTGLKSIRVNSNATAYAPIISTTSTSGNTTIKSITVSDATINLPVPDISGGLITGFKFGDGNPIGISGGTAGVSEIVPYGPDSAGAYSAGTSATGSVHIFGSGDISAQYTNTNPTGIKLSLNHIHDVPYVQVYKTHTNNSYDGVLLATKGDTTFTTDTYSGIIKAGSLSLYDTVNENSATLAASNGTLYGNFNGTFSGAFNGTFNGTLNATNITCDSLNLKYTIELDTYSSGSWVATYGSSILSTSTAVSRQIVDIQTSDPHLGKIKIGVPLSLKGSHIQYILTKGFTYLSESAISTFSIYYQNSQGSGNLYLSDFDISQQDGLIYFTSKNRVATEQSNLLATFNIDLGWFLH